VYLAGSLATILMRSLLTLALLFAATQVAAQTPGPRDLVVNEIAYDPPAPQVSTNEWVEVVNRSGAARDIGGLTVGDAGATSAPVPGPLLLPPGGYAVLVRNAAAFEAAYPGVPYVALAGFPALNNTGDRVAIAVGGTEIDAVPYLGAWGGTDASLERIDPEASSTDPANFATTTSPDAGTPGAQNAVFGQNQDTTPPELDGAEALDALTVAVSFSEPVDPASALDAARYAIDGRGAPAAASATADPAVVRLTLAAPLTGPATYTLTVTGIADLAGNVLVAAQTTFFFGQGDAPQPGDLVINEFLYDPPGADNPGEYVELYNRSDRTFDLRDFTLNDAVGADEPVTGAPDFLGPGAYAVVVDSPALFDIVFPGVPRIDQPLWSALNNTGDAIVLRYRGALVDSLTFTPSWGGVDASLERRDPAAPSSIAVNWRTSADLRGGTPGARNSRFEPDAAGPALLDAAPSLDGLRLTVGTDEPLDPASVSAGAFSLSGGPAVTGAAYAPLSTTVELTLGARLPAGSSTLTAAGLRDLVGNTSASASVAVTFVPDETPPALTSAVAESATTVRVAFSEPVEPGSASAPGAYIVDGGIGVASAVTLEPGTGGIRAAVLTLGQPLAERTLYMLTASGLADLAGNASPSATAPLFFGDADVPQRGQLVLTEILYDPADGSDGEYIEVHNTTTDRLFDLRTVTLDDGDAADARALASRIALVPPGAYVAVVRQAEAFATRFPGVPFVVGGSVISLSNSGEAVVLRADGAVVDSVAYAPDWHRVELDDAGGVSLERRDPAGVSTAPSNWSSSLDTRGGTPSAANSVSLAPGPTPRTGGLDLTSPFRPDDGQAAQIGYTLRADAALVRARVFDGGGRLVREIEDGRLSGPSGTLVWDGRGASGERLRAGIYVVLVEAVDAQGGTTEAYRGALVLARL
jgi:hypothetical protein